MFMDEIFDNISEEIRLDEMPKLIIPTDFQLNDTAFNRKLAAELLSKKKETFEDNENYELFLTGNKINGYIVLYLKDEKQIGYLIKYQTQYRKFIDLRVVTQLALWRQPGQPYVSGITKHVFFDILLPKFGAVMSDGQQTEYGMNFWKDRMAEASLSSYDIGFADFGNHKINWWNKNDKFNNWLNNLNAWGEANRDEYRRFVIKKI
jgi:hypothetical protein